MLQAVPKMAIRKSFFQLLAAAGCAVAIGPFAHAALPNANRCIAPVSYWPLDGALVGSDSQGVPALGTYERISPDGRFVLRSYSAARVGAVSLIELPPIQGQPMKVYRTPLSNEAFPVQGSWRYLVDVDGRHFRLKDIVQLQARARPLFRGGMSGFYAAASEMSDIDSPDTGLVWIRSMSWPQGGREGQGTGPLQIRTLGIQDGGDMIKVVSDSGGQFICGARSVTDGNVYTLPMISVDGTEFSALPINPARGDPSMRIYGLSPDAMAPAHPCDLRTDLQATPGKAVFGFASPGSHTMLAYTHNGSVYFVDRRPDGAAQAFQIEDLQNRVLASAFPGITRDGRIVFGASWQQCSPKGECQEQTGYVIADPLQNADYRQAMAQRGVALPKACTTEADVARERGSFATSRGLAP
jgi:hypothetical protein